MPEIAFISCDLRQYGQSHLYFIFELGQITKNLAIKSTHADYEKYECIFIFFLEERIICCVPVLELES